MANPLRDFTISEPIFIDTSIFVYHQVAHPLLGPDCLDFLDKVEHGNVQAVTTDVVVNEVAYVLQMQRVADLVGTTRRPTVHARLAADTSLAEESWLAVEGFLDLLDALQHSGLTVIEAGLSDYRQACIAGRHYRLVISDATHAAVCEQLGIEHVASRDADLDRVLFLTRWQPGS
jgi:predicted nucleic acid-binding protein